MNTLSFVIPVYNSEKTIALVVDEIEKAVHNLKDTYFFEIILVNDCSKDNSLSVCRKLCDLKANVTLISFSKNFGQHHALIAGMRKVTGDYVICLDDDLQTHPREIGNLIDILENGFDVVFGQYGEKKHSSIRNIGTKMNEMMANALLNKPKNISMTSFFIARRYVIDEVIKYDNPYPYLPGLLFRVTRSIGGTFVEHHERQSGKSNYNFLKLVSLWLNGFTNFSVKPLRIASVFGFVLSFTGFIITIFLVVKRLVTNYVTMGWTSVMVMIIFFGGIQLISLGLVGEYVGRIYLCINKTPQYIIKEIYKNGKVEE